RRHGEGCGRLRGGAQPREGRRPAHPRTRLEPREGGPARLRLLRSERARRAGHEAGARAVAAARQGQAGVLAVCVCVCAGEGAYLFDEMDGKRMKKKRRSTDRKEKRKLQHLQG
ncbi:hypothetical protein DQ04_06301000, partial [Trypanosoma grayi]|uniref:hypothetical protein n=1 Tax=Trypanosoma grayi TaxID=71804 RepID=UPI0004F43933